MQSSLWWSSELAVGHWHEQFPPRQLDLTPFPRSCVRSTSIWSRRVTRDADGACGSPTRGGRAGGNGRRRRRGDVPLSPVALGWASAAPRLFLLPRWSVLLGVDPPPAPEGSVLPPGIRVHHLMSGREPLPMVSAQIARRRDHEAHAAGPALGQRLALTLRRLNHPSSPRLSRRGWISHSVAIAGSRSDEWSRVVVAGGGTLDFLATRPDRERHAPYLGTSMNSGV